ncbi:hypothetical protein AB0H37_18975 [Actinomadura sp. NPDC023710]|uniref:hypothetical protein n=1 Tax=Actinomadura sp. NPDC023710 TaxID=3158219 RepID=UPI0033E402AF
MPERYEPWPTLYQQLRRWSADWSAVCVGSTIVRAHQHASAPARRGTAGDETGITGGRAGTGRARSGLTSSVPSGCDARGLPLAFTVTAGNVDDCTRLIEVVEAIAVRPAGSGPRAPGPGT